MRDQREEVKCEGSGGGEVRDQGGRGEGSGGGGSER